MEYSTRTTDDGCEIAYQASSSLKNACSGDALVLLLHGFAGSSAYFTRNYPGLLSDNSTTLHVVAWDMRGHGRSSKTTGGYHVARLAADLHFLLAHLDRGRRLRVIGVGCSIGAAVLWTHIELFSPASAHFAGLVIVDQAPLQDREPYTGWTPQLAHRGLYDEATLHAAQKVFRETPDDGYRGLVADCLGYRYAPLASATVSEEEREQDEAFFLDIARACDGKWLARLMADHTRYDHRDAIAEAVDVPALVLAGTKSGPFSIEGMRETANRINNGIHSKSGQDLAEFREIDAGHWMFYEKPQEFNELIINFIRRCQ
ncbi:hypothetical protein PYCC9005_001522 [Savitreella phatthalungensis]